MPLLLLRVGMVLDAFRGLAIAMLWGWLAVPFGLPAIAWWQGVLCLWLMFGFVSTEAKEKTDKEMALQMALHVFKSGMLILGGALIHYLGSL